MRERLRREDGEWPLERDDYVAILFKGENEPYEILLDDSGKDKAPGTAAFEIVK